MNRRAFVPFCVVALLSVGCEDPPGDDVSGPPRMGGTYLAKTPGAIAAISFVDEESYVLMKDGCRERACAESGRYALDAAAGSVRLTDGSGAERILSLRVLAVAAAPSPAATRSLASAPGDDTALVEEGVELLPGTITRMELERQTMQVATKAECLHGIPTPYTKPALVAAYWARCPNGVLT